MKPYHPNNLKHQPYGHGRVILLAWAAKFFGVQFHLHGIPFGAAFRAMPGEEPEQCAEGWGGIIVKRPGGTGGFKGVVKGTEVAI